MRVIVKAGVRPANRNVGKFMNPTNSNQGNPRIGTEPEEIVLFPLAGGSLDDHVKAWIGENPEYDEESRYESSRVVTFENVRNTLEIESLI